MQFAMEVARREGRETKWRDVLAELPRRELVILMVSRRLEEERQERRMVAVIREALSWGGVEDETPRTIDEQIAAVQRQFPGL